MDGPGVHGGKYFEDGGFNGVYINQGGECVDASYKNLVHHKLAVGLCDVESGLSACYLSKALMRSMLVNIMSRMEDPHWSTRMEARKEGRRIHEQ